MHARSHVAPLDRTTPSDQQVFLLLSFIFFIAALANSMLWSFFIAATAFASHVFVLDVDKGEWVRVGVRVRVRV